MKNLKFLFVAFLAVVLASTIACSDDDKFVPDSAVRAAFETYFPNATGATWYSRAGYAVVNFYEQGLRKSAWFSKNGMLEQTETDVPVSGLPENIRQLIDSGKYAGWKIDDVDYVEGRGMEPVYIVELENGEQEVDLYFSADGTLLKEVIDTDDDDNSVCPITPNPSNNDVISAVMEKYPNAKILEIDREGKYYEIDLWMNNAYYEMILDASFVWVETSMETTWNRVPDVVKRAFESDGYVFDSREDDVDVVYRPGKDVDVVLYRIELDCEPRDVVLFYAEDGTLVK